MKLLSLNIWGGKQFDVLIDYIQKHSHDVDVFCFQEVFNTPTAHTTVDRYYRANIFSELQEILPDHQWYHAPVQWWYGFESPTDFDICWGLALFVRKSLQVVDIWDIYLYLHLNAKIAWDNSSIGRNLQYVKIHDGKSAYTIGHFHGYRNGKGKTDTPERIAQSTKARKFFDSHTGKRILCGDFNLLPHTESIAILEWDDFTNLIKTYNITTTRSNLYTKPEKFADYTFVSPEVEVKNFSVPYTEASDHLPMHVEFN